MHTYLAFINTYVRVCVYIIKKCIYIYLHAIRYTQAALEKYNIYVGDNYSYKRIKWNKFMDFLSQIKVFNIYMCVYISVYICTSVYI